MSHIRELYRRLRMATAAGVTTGPITIGPDGLPVVQVRLASMELLNLRVVEQRGIASDLPIGTPVMAQFIGGDRSNGFINGSTSPNDRPATAGTDDRVFFAHGWTILMAADGIHLNGPVFVNGNQVNTGDITATGEITRGAGSADQVDLGGHKHTSSGSGSPTSAPIAGT